MIRWALIALLVAGCRDTGRVLVPIIYPAPAVLTVTLPDGMVGEPYSFTLIATGGDGRFVWRLSAGALPDGLSLNPNTGLISGTPTSATAAGSLIRVRSR